MITSQFVLEFSPRIGIKDYVSTEQPSAYRFFIADGCYIILIVYDCQRDNTKMH